MGLAVFCGREHIDMRKRNRDDIADSIDLGVFNCNHTITLALRQFVEAIQQRRNPWPNQSNHTAVLIQLL
jgi:hypothetical protein